jgi:trans-aconitate 2-methyltransferase
MGLLEEEVSTYNWNAREYEKYSQSQQIWARELINKLNLKGTEDILDLGCGEGKITADIAKLVNNGSVTGVDSSKSMIALATEKYPASHHPNLSFRVMDAGQLPFKESFDLVFSNAALHWIKNHQPLLAGIYNSLRSGGKILLQMGGEGNAGSILSVFEQVQSHSAWQPYFSNFEFPYAFFGTEEYTKLLSEAGFSVKHVELFPKGMEHAGKPGLEGWIRTTWLPYTERVPEEKRDTFIKTISEKYVENVPMDSNGNVHVTMVRLEVEAEKKAPD